MNRTHTNGEFRLSHSGQTVTVLGWVAKRRNFGSIVFMDLRDRTGIVQCVFNEELTDKVKDVRSEYILKVTGVVLERKDKNPKLLTGEVEINVTDVTIINTSESTPIIIADETDALEDTRLRFRYLDLRRPMMQKKLMQRHAITKAMRNFLDDEGFIEVETPLLTKSTPEGSREYLVPSRVHTGEFYALAQSPQIFKQMLMIAGFERYYQVARCFRDEDLRSDRQLDFTQVDIEASFLSEVEFQSIMETMMVKVFKEVLGRDLPVPFRRIPFDEAMNRYGVDKPDIRYGLELNDVTSLFEASEFKVFSSVIERKGSIKALIVNDYASISRKEIDSLTELAKKYGAKGLVVVKLANGLIEGPAAKFLSETEKNALVTQLNLKENDLVLMVADEWEKACVAAGALRTYFRDALKLVSEDQFEFAWVVDFPLFEYDSEEDRLIARHHPFTRPKAEDAHLLDTVPLSVKACAYDLVLNGFEVAGGSLRIYDQQMQSKLFSLIGFTDEQIEKRFGFFVDAFKYGTPPHGGIAFGLDRLAMILTHSESLRDVIAFPKNASARCPLTDAPTPVEKKQLDELHLTVVK
ncbi:MAG: aspartate--tRNA ligase [Firmicutes bacterium HGW-Firmicutes-19]|nr:MAG: aspartate--tRNA ligase [Firmicutes bacterium HGW-Firmicutes-19]